MPFWKSSPQRLHVIHSLHPPTASVLELQVGTRAWGHCHLHLLGQVLHQERLQDLATVGSSCKGNVARTTLCGSPASATLRNGEHGREDVEEMMAPMGPAHRECQGGVWTSSFADALLRHFGFSLNLFLLTILIILAAVQNNNDRERNKS